MKDIAPDENNNRPNDHDVEKGEKRKRGIDRTKEKDHHEEEQKRNEREEYKNKPPKQDKKNHIERKRYILSKKK